MPFKVETPAEAYAAISLLVVGADGVGTMEERDFLFDQLGALDVFAGHDSQSFGAMLGAMTGRLVSSLSSDGAPPDADAVRELCSGARDVLDADQRLELFSSAVKVARSDGMEQTERVMLRQIADGLGIDVATAQQMMA